jgi:CheY-like chemotaxis protein
VRLRDIVLVALTGHGLPHDHRRAFEAGFDARLVKPADPEELHELPEQVGAPA